MGSPYEFIAAAACRDPKVNNCLEVAANVDGVIAIRESEQPGTVIETTRERWSTFVAAIQAGEYDL